MAIVVGSTVLVHVPAIPEAERAKVKEPGAKVRGPFVVEAIRRGRSVEDLNARFRGVFYQVPDTALLSNGRVYLLDWLTVVAPDYLRLVEIAETGEEGEG